MPVFGVFSARSDGATTVSVGLAAVLSQSSRTLLIDLNLQLSEIAPLLDLDSTRNLFHLAYNAQLAPVDGDDLEAHLSWRDGIGVLPGVRKPGHVESISDHFLSGLLEAAAKRFDNVVLDLGRVRAELPATVSSGQLLWVVSPTPLGMDALERRYWQLDEAAPAWLQPVRVVLNRVNESSLVGTDRYVEREYDLKVAGSIPDTPDFWRRVELQHSPRALNVSDPKHPRYRKTHGEQALRARQAFQELAQALTTTPERTPEPVLSA